MKKISTAALFVVMLSGVRPAMAGDFMVFTRMGIKTGLSLSLVSPTLGLNGAPNTKGRSMAGWHFGATYRFDMLDVIYVQPELLYNHIGYSMNIYNPASAAMGVAPGEQVRIRNILINMPVLLGLQFGMWQGYAGPVFNLYSLGNSSNSNISNILTNYPTLGYAVGAGIAIGIVDFDLRICGTGRTPTQRFMVDNRHVMPVNLSTCNMMLSVGLMF